MKKMPLEARLCAYIDGETSREEKDELDRVLATDPAARHLLDALRHGSDVGRKAFDEVLKEPVPLSVVRSIKSVQPPKAREARRFSRPSLKLAPTGKQALAASLILFVLGGGIGYLLGKDPSAVQTAAQPVTPTPASRGWLDDITAHHRLFSRQPGHLVELPASQLAEITSWLTGNVGVAFRVPDLTSEDLELQGARLLLAGGRPAGQLIYKSSDGDVVSIFLMRDDSAGEISDFKETIKDDLGIVAWHNAGAAYVLVAPSADPTLDELAKRISKLM
jgi:anti-sigma factor RsiW